MNSILAEAYPNFRSLGGLKTADGSVLREGMIFRSPDLEKKDSAVTQALAELKLDYIVDLRCKIEVFERKDVSILGTEYRNLPVLKTKPHLTVVVCWAGKLLATYHMMKGTAKVIQDQKFASYKAICYAPAYKEVFSLMDQGKTFDFHCTEGKDRTGWLAVLIEYSLGRTKEDIFKEYMKSNELRPGKDRSWLTKLGIPAEQVYYASYCEFVHPELFHLAWNQAVSDYGTFDAYLEQVFGITEERKNAWKQIYVTKE